MNFMVRMTHPEHGAMHVYNKEEFEKHVKLGWVSEEPKPEEPKKRGRPKKVAA